MIGLIEFLLKDWYIGRPEREEQTYEAGHCPGSREGGRQEGYATSLLIPPLFIGLRVSCRVLHNFMFRAAFSSVSGGERVDHMP